MFSMHTIICSRIIMCCKFTLYGKQYHLPTWYCVQIFENLESHQTLCCSQICKFIMRISRVNSLDYFMWILFIKYICNEINIWLILI